MTASRQGDLFGADAPATGVEDCITPTYRPDLGKVRVKLRQILAEARAAEVMPWDADRLLVYRTIFPQMAHWLPDEEAAQLRFDFETELKRLKAA